MAEHHVVAHDLRLAQDRVMEAARALVDWWDPRDTDEWSALQSAVADVKRLEERYEEVRPRWQL